MKKKAARAYRSPVRERQAGETRAKIAAAARRLILAKGYEVATMEAIAREAGVAAPTVYAVFGSKRKILTGLIDQASFGPAFDILVDCVMAIDDPAERVRFAATISRQVYEAEQAEFALLREAGVVAPELAAIENEIEARRYTGQASTVALLAKAGNLAPGLNEADARAILWTLTGRETYRMLVAERGWTPARYEDWLGKTLVVALVAPARERRT